MELNTKMLLEALQSKTEVRLLGPDRPKLNLHFPCFYSGDLKQLICGGVYLTTCSPLPESDVAALWVTWGEVPEHLTPRDSVLFFLRRRTLFVF